MEEIEKAKQPRLLAGYLHEDEVCEEMGITRRTTRRYRQCGEGPPYVRACGGIYYPEADFREWMRSGVQRPVRSRGRAA
jgi:predicted site-specific integrase-resolvase